MSKNFLEKNQFLNSFMLIMETLLQNKMPLFAEVL